MCYKLCDRLSDNLSDMARAEELGVGEAKALPDRLLYEALVRCASLEIKVHRVVAESEQDGLGEVHAERFHHLRLAQSLDLEVFA